MHIFCLFRHCDFDILLCESYIEGNTKLSRKSENCKIVSSAHNTLKHWLVQKRANWANLARYMLQLRISIGNRIICGNFDVTVDHIPNLYISSIKNAVLRMMKIEICKSRFKSLHVTYGFDLNQLLNDFDFPLTICQSQNHALTMTNVVET